MRTAWVCCLIVLGGVVTAAEPPATILDLTNWRLTLPVDTARSGTPDEIGQPELKAYDDSGCFYVNATAKGVVFRAHCGGDPTKGSKYPRCELREMTAAGKRASWDTGGSAVHTLTMQAAINAVPPVKQHVVCAQIHDANDDLLMVRLEGQKLFVERNSSGDVMLDSNYKLGTKFDLKVEAGHGNVKVWYDGTLKMDWDVSRKGCYFKAGCYTQSNPSQGDEADSYGEVIFFGLHITAK